MKTLILVLTVLLSTLSYAQTLRLGEWAGDGVHTVSRLVQNDIVVYEGDCRVAINVTNREDAITMSFGVFTCSGIDAWNERWNVEKRGEDLLINGKVVGKTQDGYAVFTVSTVTKGTVEEEFYNDRCQIDRFVRNTVNLNRDVTWKLHFASETEINLERAEKGQALATAFVKDPHCARPRIKKVVSDYTDLLSVKLVKKPAL